MRFSPGDFCFCDAMDDPAFKWSQVFRESVTIDVIGVDQPVHQGHGAAKQTHRQKHCPTVGTQTAHVIRLRTACELSVPRGTHGVSLG